MERIFYLSTCSTCKKILKELNPPPHIPLQDIKYDPLTPSQLDHLKKQSGSYESLFNKRARLFQEKKGKNGSLSEADFRELLLEHYTFLKRPVIVFRDKIFIGNSRKTIEAAKKSLLLH